MVCPRLPLPGHCTGATTDIRHPPHHITAQMMVASRVQPTVTVLTVGGGAVRHCYLSYPTPPHPDIVNLVICFRTFPPQSGAKSRLTAGAVLLPAPAACSLCLPRSPPSGGLLEGNSVCSVYGGAGAGGLR